MFQRLQCTFSLFVVPWTVSGTAILPRLCVDFFRSYLHILQHVVTRLSEILALSSRPCALQYAVLSTSSRHYLTYLHSLLYFSANTNTRRKTWTRWAQHILQFVHLTNDAVQRRSSTYGQGEPGNKLTLEDLQSWLDGDE